MALHFNTNIYNILSVLDAGTRRAAHIRLCCRGESGYVYPTGYKGIYTSKIARIVPQTDIFLTDIICYDR